MPITTQSLNLGGKERHVKGDIHNLPSELLAQIFLFSFHQHPIIPNLQELAAVCKFWRDLVLSTPDLWTMIHDSASPTHLKWCLTRSKELALSIRSHLPYQTADQSWLDAVVAESHRWGEVQAVLATSPGLIAALDRPTPKLTNLTVQNKSHPSMRIELHDSGPSLRYLDLDKCAVPWGSGRLLGGRLTDLHLAHLDLPHSPSPDQVLHILATSAALQTIHLSFISDTDTDVPILTDHNITLTFPHLRQLTLDYLGTSLFQHLMNHLSFPFPHCDRLDIFFKSLDPDFSSFGIVEQVRMMVHSHDCIRISLYGAMICIQVPACERSEWKLNIRLRPFDTDKMVDAISQFAAIARALPDNDTFLNIKSSRTSFERILPLLHQFEHARSIMVAQPRGRSFLQYYFVQQQTGLDILFPKLQSLDLRNLSQPLDLIRSWLGARWTRIESAGTNSSSQGDKRASQRMVAVLFNDEKREMWATTIDAERFTEVEARPGSSAEDH